MRKSKRVAALLSGLLVAGSLLVGCSAGQPAAPPPATPAAPPASSSTPPPAPAAAPDPRVAQANDLILAGKPGEAAVLLATVTVEHPRDAAAWDLLTFAYIRAGEYDLAARAAKQALALAPSSPTVQFNAGLAFLKNRQAPEAIAALEAALALRPDLADTYYNLGAAYELGTQWPQAIAAYERGLARFPADADLKRARAALRTDLTQDGKPERITVQGTQVTVADEAGHVLAQWEEKTHYTPPSRVWTHTVDLGGQSPALLVMTINKVSVHVWDGKTLALADTLDEGDTVYDPTQRTLVQNTLTCQRNCQSSKDATVVNLQTVWRLKDGKLVRISSAVLPTK